MKTVVGVLMDKDGMCHKRWHERNAWHGALKTRHQVWATPSSELRHRQAERIPVDLGHDGNFVGDLRAIAVRLAQGFDRLCLERSCHRSAATGDGGPRCDPRGLVGVKPYDRGPARLLTESRRDKSTGGDL